MHGACAVLYAPAVPLALMGSGEGNSETGVFTVKSGHRGSPEDSCVISGFRLTPSGGVSERS